MLQRLTKPIEIQAFHWISYFWSATYWHLRRSGIRSAIYWVVGMLLKDPNKLLFITLCSSKSRVRHISRCTFNANYSLWRLSTITSWFPCDLKMNNRLIHSSELWMAKVSKYERRCLYAFVVKGLACCPYKKRNNSF